jgi:hypothetical protein
MIVLKCNTSTLLAVFLHYHDEKRPEAALDAMTRRRRWKERPARPGLLDRSMAADVLEAHTNLL